MSRGSDSGGPWPGRYMSSVRSSSSRRLAKYAAMSPPGGLTTLVDHDITWSALNSTALPSRVGIEKHR